MLETTRSLGRMLADRRATLLSSGRPQCARLTSAYHALSGISDNGCFCQNRRSVEIAITRIGESMLPWWEHGQLLACPSRKPVADDWTERDRRRSGHNDSSATRKGTGHPPKMVVDADDHDLTSDESPLPNDQSSRPVPTRLMKTSSRRSFRR